MDVYLKYHIDRLSQLKGCTISRPIVDESTDPAFFGLEIIPPSGERIALWFLQDDEGNGPGAFEIETLKVETVKVKRSL